MIKGADPGIPCCVEESIAGPCDGQDGHYGGIWRVGGNNDVGDYSERGGENGDSAPATEAV